MPSKKITGNNPLGSTKIDPSRGIQGAFADMAAEVGMRTPRQAMTTGSQQVHNGNFHTPKRRRASIPSGCALTPLFSISGNGTLSVSFKQQYLMVPIGEGGTYVETIPKFNGTDIVSDGEGWTKPVQALSTGDYFIWVTLKAAEAKIIVGKEEDKPDYEQGKSIYRLSSFTVAAGSGSPVVKDKMNYHCPQFIAETPLRHEGYPFVYNTGDAQSPSWSVRFTKIFIFDGTSGLSQEASNNDTEFGCQSGDKFFLRLQTDEAAGSITDFQIHKDTSAPESTEHLRIKEQAGDYYIELCEIKEAGDGSLYAEVKRSSGVLWFPNQDHGENAAMQPTDGAQIYVEEKKYPYKWRVLNPGPLPLSQSSAGVGLKWEQDGTSITPKLETQGASGSFSLAICDGGGSFAITVQNGMVTAITSGDLEAAPCDTTPPGP